MTEKEWIVETLRRADEGRMRASDGTMQELLFLAGFWRLMPKTSRSTLSMEGRQSLRALS